MMKEVGLVGWRMLDWYVEKHSVMSAENVDLPCQEHWAGSLENVGLV